MAYFFGALVTFLMLYTLRTLRNLIRNIVNARAIGLPTVFVPVDQSHVLWLILSPSVKPILQRLLPAKLWQRVAITIFGWEFHEKMWPFDQFKEPHNGGLGRSYFLAGTSRLDLWTADPEATQDILARVRDFKVPEDLEYALAQYGPNVLTANGDRWAKHRRIVTTVIDERISKAVFEESAYQTHGLLDELFPPTEDKPDSVETILLFDMLKKITIHVLIGTGMGKRTSWNDGESQKLEPGYTMTHIESLTTVVANLVGAAMIPTGILTHWPSWLPGYRKMATVGSAKLEVHKRSKSILDNERHLRTKGETSESATSNIMSKLLKASGEGSTSGQFLTEGEMISNLFIFTAAGFETTATTLAYAMVLLARYPQWQDWLTEEVDDLTSANGSESLDYTTIFPRATRIMAFMFETVRLYSPVPHVHREITAPQTLQTATGTVQLPAGTRVYVNAVALHLLPSWRDINRQSDPAFFVPDPRTTDEHEFRPSRWLNPLGSTHAIYRPPKGAFVPWAMGPRVCPGQKMAQVEFMAVMLTLLRKHVITAVSLHGESQREVGERLDARLSDSRWVTVLQMNGVFDPKNDEGLCMKISKRR